MIEIESEHMTELFTGFGERGVSAEKVASQCARRVERYIASELPVGEHLADQLLLWIALAGGGEFRTAVPSEHTTTHARVIREFLDVDCRLREEKSGGWRVSV